MLIAWDTLGCSLPTVAKLRALMDREEHTSTRNAEHPPWMFPAPFIISSSTSISTTTFPSSLLSSSTLLRIDISVTANRLEIDLPKVFGRSWNLVGAKERK